jgi:predicted enzyme related to lactoylglutathione lyase
MTGNILRTSGVSYLHLPARNIEDVRRSARFYADVLGWTIRGTEDDPQFEDGTGDVAGAWVIHRSPSPDSGILPYIYVEDVPATLELVLGHGGAVVTQPFPEGDLTVATIRDPAGNEIGLWTQSQVR